MQLTWKASESASALYAATCLAEGLPIADARLAEALAPAVESLLAECATCGVSTEKLLPLLNALAASGVENNRHLVEQALTKLVGAGTANSALADRLASGLGGWNAAFQQAYRALVAEDAPPLVDELLLRGRPLAQQWEARGPGLLLGIARATEQDVVAERAGVVLVYPIVGGHGVAHLPVNTVTFEAVLANPHDDLPETLRLAWLLAQLNTDLPTFSDQLSADHRPQLSKLAMVPPVLAAAEHVELGRCTADSIARALMAWRVTVATAETATTADTLLTWWTTYQQGATPWAVGLAALERMLFG